MRKRQAKKIRIAENRMVRKYRRKTSEAAFRAVVKARRKRCRRDSLVAFWRHTWGGGFDPSKGQDFTASMLVLNDQSDALAAAVLALRQYDKPPVKQLLWPEERGNCQQIPMRMLTPFGAVRVRTKDVVDLDVAEFRKIQAEMVGRISKHVERIICGRTME